MTIFYTSDLHLGHNNIIKPTFQHGRSVLFKTIEEHDFGLVDRWNAKVGPEDTVYVLGDLCYRAGFKWLQFMNGKMYLVAGNHDRYDTKKYMSYFKRIYGAFQIGKLILTHIPVHPLQLKDDAQPGGRYLGNVHGHLHDKALDDPRYLNVGIDRTADLAPMAAEEIVAQYGSRWEALLTPNAEQWADQQDVKNDRNAVAPSVV